MEDHDSDFDLNTTLERNLELDEEPDHDLESLDLPPGAFFKALSQGLAQLASQPAQMG